MNVIELPIKSNFDELTYHDEVLMIVRYFENHNIKLNVDLNTVEKLWYAFSEGYDAAFLIPDDELISQFINYIKDIDVSTADHMDYYGDIKDHVYRPWDNDKEDE